jgi:hypothetical protein
MNRHEQVLFVSLFFISYRLGFQDCDCGHFVATLDCVIGVHHVYVVIQFDLCDHALDYDSDVAYPHHCFRYRCHCHAIRHCSSCDGDGVIFCDVSWSVLPTGLFPVVLALFCTCA